MQNGKIHILFNAHKIITKVNNSLSHKANFIEIFNKFQRIEIIYSIFCDYSRIKLTKKRTNMLLKCLENKQDTFNFELRNKLH